MNFAAFAITYTLLTIDLSLALEDRRTIMSVSWSELVEGVRKAFSTDRVDVNEVKRLMSSYESDRKDWMSYEKFDPHR